MTRSEAQRLRSLIYALAKATSMDEIERILIGKPPAQSRKVAEEINVFITQLTDKGNQNVHDSQSKEKKPRKTYEDFLHEDWSYI